ncbi:hypothetical protein ACLOJK_041066 [Asimina triloba]
MAAIENDDGDDCWVCPQKSPLHNATVGSSPTRLPTARPPAVRRSLPFASRIAFRPPRMQPPLETKGKET